MSSGKWLIEGKVIYDCSEGYLQPGNGERIELKYNENILFNQLIKGVFEKASLIDAIWGRVVVTDSSYHKLIFELRGQFEKAGLDPKLIKTVPRRGCVFTGVYELKSDSAVDDTESVFQCPDKSQLAGGVLEHGDGKVEVQEKLKRSWGVAGLVEAVNRLVLGWRNGAALANYCIFIIVAGLGLSVGWQISNFMPSFYVHRVSLGSNSFYTVGVVYKDVPQVNKSSGDVFYIKSRRSTAVYLCDEKDRSDLNCKNQINF
ncbi:hypothetical protein J9978_02610 [Chromobacterium violaceum]|uniref:winged helix-turn-helix domain-containing protein n=1 Tax=Chromobacterium violaceum TaxID=536 RepID=UPI00111BF24E|nr:hypothetical protein [Chromobacterium violaceum]MBP4048391.1 hypothetical protein [Chromobacterium violaceum]